MSGYVYILASRKNGTLYTGVTSDLERRVWEHQEDLTPGFTSRYGVKRLVWYRDYADIRDAIDDEKRIKRWRRKWKLELIEAMNPKWEDLAELLGR
ncbi:MAG: GIY-YIG nuclease family protein [Rhizobiales bacterium]|nr:GIY-YIG nuclease family protein [Hyphomicrobiales bacterium]